MAEMKKSDNRHVLTLPLRCEPYQRDYLDKYFSCVNNTKNALISRMKKVLADMESDPAYIAVNDSIRDAYKVGDKTALRELFRKKDEILKSYKIRQFDFQSSMKNIAKHYKGLIHSQVAQRASDQVWASFEKYLFGNGETIDFSPYFKHRSIEGKSNNTGIRYKDGELIVNRIRIPVAWSRNDKYGYEAECKTHRICYCRITRRPGKDGKWMYFVQLVLEGTAPVKADPDTGAIIHPIGTGSAGIDIGPQTVAVVSNSNAALNVLAENLDSIEKEVNRIQRAMDRSRRATNQMFFDASGQIIRVDKLPPNLLKRGKRKWSLSKRYTRLRDQKRYLQSKQSVTRLRLHREMANQIVSFGDTFIVEDMNWKALAKRAKETKKSEKTGKCVSKKRFGKSIASKAPATFINTLEYKVLQQGGKFYRVDPKLPKASQYNHLDHAYKKKHLSQRWVYQNGRKDQRDLYSAFLLAHWDNDQYNQSKLDADYPNFCILHDQCIAALAAHSSLPVSTGIRK